MCVCQDGPPAIARGGPRPNPAAAAPHGGHLLPPKEPRCQHTHILKFQISRFPDFRIMPLTLPFCCPTRPADSVDFEGFCGTQKSLTRPDGACCSGTSGALQ